MITLGRSAPIQLLGDSHNFPGCPTSNSPRSAGFSGPPAHWIQTIPDTLLIRSQNPSIFQGCFNHCNFQELGLRRVLWVSRGSVAHSQGAVQPIIGSYSGSARLKLSINGFLGCSISLHALGIRSEYRLPSFTGFPPRNCCR